MKSKRISIAWLALFRFFWLAFAASLAVIAARAEELNQSSICNVFPDRPQQVIKGIGFEIQSDSIGSGNHGLPDSRIAVPHDLVPSERERLAAEMLKGFRYCRLAGGLYWRGLDPQKKFLEPRWPEQLTELRDLLNAAGVEGVSFEYWSPAPFWKGNQSYIGTRGGDLANRLRCFSPGFAQDPVYHGDTNRFLVDFADAVVTDIKTLHGAGIKTSMWGLQNEPNVNNGIYSSCEYPNSPDYVKAYRAVAGAIRKYDPNILLFADTEGGFPKKIGPAMKDPEVVALVDAYVVHIVGSSSETPLQVQKKITAKLPPRPWFQNEYEYLTGGATPERCLNTVQHIMNSFQLAGNPTWFWLHALKPLKNAEASGYSLGFWKSLEEPAKVATGESFRRWTDGPEFNQLPDDLKKLEMVSATRGNPEKPGVGYSFSVNQPVTVYLLVEDLGDLKLDNGWKKTSQVTAWDGGHDTVYERRFPAGNVSVPAHTGKKDGRYGVPHIAFIAGSDPMHLKAQIGMNLPIQIRSQALALERRAAQIQPGYWIFNPYNWNAVGSFVRHMPWNCTAVAIEEKHYDPDARILAFKKPDGKLTIVIANRHSGDHAFQIETGLADATFKGWRYTPDEAGANTMGKEIGVEKGSTISLTLGHLTWEFWEQQ